MWFDPALKDYLDNSTSIKSSGYVVAEWNMNDAANFAEIGNYRYRPQEAGSPFFSLISTWDARDVGNWYTGATNNDNQVYGPYDESNEPTIFTTTDEKMKRLYSLDDCLKPHRPRSGINYVRFGGGVRDSGYRKYVGGVGKNIANGTNNSSVNRPRYYLSDMNNSFKYYSSWRKEDGLERGISSRGAVRPHSITDCVPFVVYKKAVPTNKLVFKMQTNVGTEDLGTIQTPNGQIDDPLYGAANATTPRQWDVEVLKGGLWTRVHRFDENSVRSDSSPIVPPDGYVELVYGLKIPDSYGSTKYVDTLVNASLLPQSANQGDYFLVVSEEDALGTVYLWHNDDWTVFTNPEYGWKFNEDEAKTFAVTDLTSPASWVQNSVKHYREFEYIEGIRIVVKTMNRPDIPLELIEMSPRLVVDLTDKTASFSVSKSMGKIDETALPVAGLTASTAIIELFDNDFAFSEENSESIIADFLSANISFKFYDVIHDGNEYFIIPLGTMYSENKPPEYSDVCNVKYSLRDAFYIFENEPAPAILVKNVSLSYSLSCLLDSIGFSNYTVINKIGSNEPIIPYFFVAPDQNVAEVLEKVAKATQSAMYFDEYNNFVVACKEYVFDDGRSPAIIVDGSSSNPNGSAQPNIVDIASDEKKLFTDGTITYTDRYIQRSIGSLTQANFVNTDQNWIYLPSLLWEVSGDDATRTINDSVTKQSSYALAACPLNYYLSDALPYVNSQRKIVNNTIDLGDSVYWLPRYNGYLYSNGEIIKYDAVRYIVQGQPEPIWVSSNDEYQRYFSELPFNGKMYPDGFVRIYSEPYYETVDGQEYLRPGAVAKHGRGQFLTTVVEHHAGVPDEWLDDSKVRGIRQRSEYLFTTADPPATVEGPAGSLPEYNTKAQTSRRTGLIRNFMRDVTYTDAQVIENTTDTSGLLKSSALSFSGPQNYTLADNSVVDQRDFVSYIHREINQNYVHFGTRMRIVGKTESASDVDQTPVGSSIYYNFDGASESLILNGGSGGLGIGVNPANNTGYFLELIALTSTNLQSISDDEVGGHNVVFYKVVRDPATGDAIPIKLWGGLAEIIVDSGTFTGAQRSVSDEKTSVYDISVEYKDFASFRRFYVFMNGTQIATVDDTAPINIYNTVSLFVRGEATVLFENIWALKGAVTSDSSYYPVVSPTSVSKAFGTDYVTVGSFNRYGISGIVNNTYLSGIGGSDTPRYVMYYEEFGAIMREAAYFDIKYDKAYPAITSQISPTLNDTPGFRVSGYHGGSYGAQFLVFNVMDKTISLSEQSGNYLRIQGVSFTQNTKNELTMDKYYNEGSMLSDPKVTDSGLVLKPPRDEADKFRTLKINRSKYGKTGWSFESDYIQSQGAAQNMMEWLSEKTTRHRKLVGIDMFPNPALQLGDIVSFDYSVNGVDKVAPSTTRFVVYNIEYNRSSDGASMKVYVSEV